MISHFFIDRPIFASVLSILITLTGGVALLSLPVAQYPPITPPGVAVTINYPGASAQVVADTVAAPIEQQVNGVPGMLYMSSQMGNDGSYTLTVTFDIGTDLNTALVMVQNRVQLALPLLPTSVQNQGITIRKKTPDLLNVVNFYSPDGRYDDVYLSNYATIHVYDELLRIDGVSQINILGVGNYSTRVWLDPQKLASLNVTAGDVANAVRTQNLDAPAGALGQQPSRGRQPFERPIDTLGRLTTPEQFGDIIVKAAPGQPPPPTNAPVTLSPGTAGTAFPGSSGPLFPGGTTAGNMPGMTAGIGTSLGPSTGKAMTGAGLSGSTTAGTGAATGIGTVSGQMGSSGTTSGTGAGTAMTGGTTTGMSSAAGFTSTTSAGRLTTGGAQSSGGATTGGGADVITSGGGSAGTSRGLSISPAAPAAAVSGMLSATTLGRGPGRPAAGIVRLRDVGYVELGAQNYSLSCTFDGRPSVGLGIFQLPGTNALEIAAQIRSKMEALKANFPEGVEYQIAYDTTPFIRESVADVVQTLLEAVALVAVVVLVFLQNWRATLIPLVAVPVAIVGTFAVMAAIGFSLNNISLFGLVLAIGIVVDDAIVVVENVERWLEQGETPREAARKAMAEVTGPVVAVALVLCAVFVPCAFLGGVTGAFFRQFAVTIAVSTLISAFNSLTLSPALAAILLRPHGARRDPLAWLLDKTFGWFFRLFNWAFGIGTSLYVRVVGGLLRASLLALLVYGGLLVLTYFRFVRAPTGFVPEQDKGYLILNVQLPDSAAADRTQRVMAHIEQIAHDTPGVGHTVGVASQSLILNANAPNLGSMYVMLKPFADRGGPNLTANTIAAELQSRCAQEVPGAVVTAFGAPPIDGLGTTGGFKLIVEDRGNLGPDELQRVSDQVVSRGNRTTGLQGLFNSSRADTPWLYLEIDRTKCLALGVLVSDVFNALQVYLGSFYVNNFNEFGRTWQVNVQADPSFRDRVADIRQIQVRNNQDQMVRLGTVLSVRDTSGPVMVMRYNMYAATAITGNTAPGTSSGQAISLIQQIAAGEMPRSMATEWTELTYLQLQAGNSAIYVFALAVVFVFLVLAAQYESWALPLAVILVVPMCLLCSIVGVGLAGMEVSIFTQIGFVVLVGLASKNAILIVEFAKQRREAGAEVRQATLDASRLRLRPILMTSFAFIFGVVPLVVATGAGAEMRRSLGLAVFSGMLGVTFFGIFLTPVFFFVIQWFVGRKRAASASPPAPDGDTPRPDSSERAEPHHQS